ncbi:MAG: radical SAM family heme chaperone HemW [Kiritimatiellae bacterium]|nr:radical SAM family heme chaperone HemW [Kiritimatiellia bacterium]
MFEHLYIHIPFCDGKCHYCGFYSVMAAPSLTELYVGLPAAELDVLREMRQIAAKTPIRSVYMGGGTPAMLGCDGLKRLAEGIAGKLDLSGVSEWTVELNPASVNTDILDTLRAIGANRISIGAQIFDDPTLKLIGRRHSAEDAARAVAMAQDAGFGNVGIDLIAGLPGVTDELWGQTLAHALALQLKHLSVYALSVEPGTVLAAQAAAGLRLPDEEAQLAALSQAEQVLGAAGFARYEISNYALPGLECLHNLSVWRGSDYLGLGPAAASRVGKTRWTNCADLSDYIEAVQQGRRPACERETLSDVDDALERVVFALRLAEGIGLDEIRHKFPVLSGRIGEWKKRMQGLARQQIAEPHGQRWRLTARGRDVCDAVLRELL